MLLGNSKCYKVLWDIIPNWNKRHSINYSFFFNRTMEVSCMVHWIWISNIPSKGKDLLQRLLKWGGDLRCLNEDIGVLQSCDLDQVMPLCVCAKLLQSCPTLCNPMAYQAPLSMGFFREEFWSELPCHPQGDLPDPGNEPMSLYVSCIGRWVLYH